MGFREEFDKDAVLMTGAGLRPQAVWPPRRKIGAGTQGIAASQLPVTDAEALKPSEYGVNVDDSQSACAAQQFAAPLKHRRDDHGGSGHGDRHSSCHDGIGSSHLDIDVADSNAKLTNPVLEIVIPATIGIKTSLKEALTWNPAPATALANG